MQNKSEKNIIQDIKPTQQKSLGTVKRRSAAIDLPQEIPYVPAPQKESSKHALWIIAVIFILGLFFALSFLFESATVTVRPKTIPVAFDATDIFTATKDSNDSNTLSYMIMSVSGDTSINLPATKTEDLVDFAKGRVTMFNAYSTTPFKIVKNTPIKSKNGVLYKVDNQIFIPGYTKSNGSITPGSIDVTVTCATSGEIGNIDSTDFSVPYFDKRPQAGKIFARTSTSISGGITGTLHTIPQSSADMAYQSLKDKLQQSLIAKTRVQVPDGYLFYSGATVFTTDDTVVAPYSRTDQIPLALHGKLTTYLIKQDPLVKNIVSTFVNNYNDEPVTIPKLSSLTFVPSSDKPFDPDNDTTITFTFDGSAKILWNVNIDDVKNQLVGVEKSAFEGILAGIPGVENADVVIKPFWKQAFPTDPKKINVDVISPTN